MLAVAEGRALLTNNVKDFAPIASRLAAEGRSHHGLLFVSDRTIRRSHDTIGAYVRALDAFLRTYHGEDRLGDQVRWLKAAAG